MIISVIMSVGGRQIIRETSPTAGWWYCQGESAAFEVVRDRRDLLFLACSMVYMSCLCAVAFVDIIFIFRRQRIVLGLNIRLVENELELKRELDAASWSWN